jgi:hypothetical protein
MSRAKYLLEKLDYIDEYSKEDYESEVAGAKSSMADAKSKRKQAKVKARKVVRQGREDVMSAKLKRVASGDKNFKNKELLKHLGVVGGVVGAHQGLKYAHRKAKEQGLYDTARKKLASKISGES